MMAENDRKPDLELEAFFEAERNAAPEAEADLLARVLADAYAEQDAIAPTAPARPAFRQNGGWMRGLYDALGGWPAMAGLATAAVVGVWIGFNPPSALDGISLALMDSSYGPTMNTSLPEFDLTLADG